MASRPQRTQGSVSVPQRRTSQVAQSNLLKQDHPAVALQRMMNGQGRVQPGDLKSLQATLGNRAVQRLIAQRSVQKPIQRQPKRGTSDKEVMDRIHQYDTYVAEASKKFNIPETSIRAIIATESRGIPGASSGAAFGLMQITRGTWGEVQKRIPDLKSYDFGSNWKDPRINILFGTAVFNMKMKSVGVDSHDEGASEVAILAYNAGEGTIAHAIKLAKAAGSKQPAADCTKPEFLKPAIRKTGIYSYYTTGQGSSRNPEAKKNPRSEAAIDFAVDLKYKEVSQYPGTVRRFLAVQGVESGSTTAPTPAPTTTGGQTPVERGAGGKTDGKPGHTQWEEAPTLDAVRAGQAVLHQGHRGPAVSFVQKHLRIAHDGKFGHDTAKAVQDFQAKNAKDRDPFVRPDRSLLRVDGKVGKKTLDLIEIERGAGGKTNQAEQHQDERASASGFGLDPAIEALNLTEPAKSAAYKVKAKHPWVVFTSGRRDLSGQARAMAGNVVTSRKWIAETYAASPIMAAAQRWVDSHPEARTKQAIADGLLGVFRSFPSSEIRRFSRHLVGLAFDIQPVISRLPEIKPTIRSLPGMTKFLTKEGGKTIWHVQFG